MSEATPKKKKPAEKYYEELARRFCDETLTDKDTLAYAAVHWNGSTYCHDGKRYIELTERELCQRLRQFCLARNITQNNRIIGNVVPIVHTLIYQDRHIHDRMPFYRGAASNAMYNSNNIIAYQNGLLDVEAYLAGNMTLLPHTPLWVSTSCLPYDFDPAATCPRWLQFIKEVFPKEDGQADLMQQFFGYCLTHDTSLQKFMLWTGVGCNGKGTAWEVLRGLVGEDAAGAFTLGQLAREFGLAPLARRMVAYCGEAELKGVHDRASILEKLKGITGEDTQHCAVKYDPEGLTMTLPTRLVIACNELPTLYETTGALSRRMLLVRFDECFQGREDFGLRGKLLAELPGIANWAMGGLKRLRAAGRFIVPSTTQAAINDYRRDNSPEYAFIQDCLMVSHAVNPGNLNGVELTDDDTISTNKAAVEGAYRKWCLENDREADETKWGWFWRSIAAIMPRIKERKSGRGDARVYGGIVLKSASDTGQRP